MSGFACWFWWFLAGVLIGLLLAWLLAKLLRKDAPTPVAAFAGPAPVRPPPPIDLAAARLAGFTLRGPDDLTVIEGIGPKISELMKASGVATFANLALSSVPELQKILDQGGANFTLADPATWPHQAQLIVENRWQDLKAFQDQLGSRSGG